MRAGAATQIQSRLPISFEPHEGEARFIARGLGYSLFITDAEAVAVVNKATLRIGFSGARAASITAEDALPGHANYFIGHDASKWRTDVPMFRRVVARDVYPGIDLVYYGTGQNLEYDFIVHPGADPNKIRLSFTGADRIEQEAGGDLVLHVAGGTIRQHLPVVYQESNGGRRTPLHAGYRRTGSHAFAFDVAHFDRTKTLVIDPTIAWSTYLGGGDDDEGQAITVDAAGNTYVAGKTSSTNFPTVAPYQPSMHGIVDAFVVKYDPAGSSLVYATYLGGGNTDVADGIAVNGAGEAFVAGYTLSADFPTTAGAYQQLLLGGEDGFVTRLNSSGNALIYSTFLGPSAATLLYGIALDAAGNAHVAGYTGAPDFPTTPGAFQTTLGGGSDAVLSVLNSAGSSLLFSTYIGGNGSEEAYGVAVDPAGNTYLTGATNSTNFPTSPGSFQPAGSNGPWVAKFSPTYARVYSTYLGAGAGFAVAGDLAGNAYVAGLGEAGFPVTPGAPQSSLESLADAFVTKLNPTGTALVYSTFLGGTGDEYATGISLDAASNAYVCGFTSSTDFPVVNATQSAFGGGAHDAFVTKINAAGSAFLFSTYLGGSLQDQANAIHVNADGHDIRVTGYTTSPDFPTVHSLQATAAPQQIPDAFVTKIVFGDPDLTITKSHPAHFIQGTGPLTYTIHVTNIGNEPTNGTVTVTDTLPAGMTATAMSGTGWSCNTSTVTCTTTTSIAPAQSYPDITLTADVSPSAVGNVVNTATVSGGGEVNTTNDTATDPTTVLPITAIPVADGSVLAALAVLIVAIAAMQLKR